mmetsp:Transcript_21196/g.48125  ORF Transcript_21196/g.48125 Transcript_21196/m.48125 type:complete len:661 (-) Transcript_21196:265-2247(-)
MKIFHYVEVAVIFLANLTVVLAYGDTEEILEESIEAKSQLKKESIEAKECDFNLYQRMFDEGTYVISKPGLYCLAEDISFNPNSAAYLRTKFSDQSITAYEASMPLHSQYATYNPRAYGVGFFAAIAVSGDNVILDLRGHVLQQDKEHALLQRFYANIETADRPFIPGQGPHDFGSKIGSARSLLVTNGRIGRSSHHGIHGNRSVNVTLQDLNIYDFEVAGMSVNACQGLIVKDVDIKSRDDVPVLGQFSALLFLRPYVNYLAAIDSPLTFRGRNATEIKASMKKMVNNVHKDLILAGRDTIDRTEHPKEWALFHNKERVIDGNCYGLLINSDGAAVNGFPSDVKVPSRQVRLENVQVKRLRGNIREIVGMAAHEDTSAVATDPIGSLLQLLAVDSEDNFTALSSDGKYVGNTVTNAQMLVAHAVHVGAFDGSRLSTKRNTIPRELVEWAEKGSQTLLEHVSSTPHGGPHGTGFLCNGDQMFHVNKGVIGFKLDGSESVQASKIRAGEISNIGGVGSQLCGNYIKSHPKANFHGYGGAFARVMTICGTKDANVTDFHAEFTSSRSGSVVGLEIATDSENVQVQGLSFGKLQASSSAMVPGSPTPDPLACGIRIGEEVKNISVNEFCVRSMAAFDDKFMKYADHSGNGSIGECVSMLVERG